MSISDIYLLGLKQKTIKYCKKCNKHLDNVFDECPFCYSSDLIKEDFIQRE